MALLRICTGVHYALDLDELHVRYHFEVRRERLLVTPLSMAQPCSFLHKPHPDRLLCFLHSTMSVKTRNLMARQIDHKEAVAI